MQSRIGHYLRGGVLAMGAAVLIPFEKHSGLAERLVVSRATEVNGSVWIETIVQKNCFLHIRGNLDGDLTIEPGASVVVDGSINGRIANQGGRLVVHDKWLTASVTLEGPAEREADAILKINLTAIAFNWETLAKRTDAECAVVVKCNAYGCGISPVADALAKSGCQTFFVADLSEARRVRAVAPSSTIYVLHGFFPGAGPCFAEANARPIINSAIELAAWDRFVASTRWNGGYALNVDTGKNGLGLSVEEIAALAPRINVPNHGITLLMSTLTDPEGARGPQTERQIGLMRGLRRLYPCIPTSLASSSAILRNPNCHFDLVRAGSELLGINPIPGSPNPMLPVIEVSARIVQIRDKFSESVQGFGNTRRIAFLSVGHADGFPRPTPPNSRLHALVGGHRCPVAGPASLDLLPIDITDLPDMRVAAVGEMATLIGSEITIDEVAAARDMTGAEVLSGLGNRFHRIYYAT
jgi:alanine racemase